MASPNGTRVVVVGSANLDIVVSVTRFPGPGETVLGGDPVELPGGKGLNQAIAAARLTSTALVACVGDDSAGRMLVSRLEEAGVDTRHVRRVATPTGRAFIQVAPDGENSIVVASAANAKLTPKDVQQALSELRPAVVLAQLEVPLESVLAAASWASAHGARFVLNPSPVQQLPARLIERCDPIVVNAIEAAEVLGAAPGTDIAELASGLGSRAVSVVVTDGSRGAYVGTLTSAQHVPGQRVDDVVDTTGAGDEFAGCLAALLATGGGLVTCAEGANRAAAGVVGTPRDHR